MFATPSILWLLFLPPLVGGLWQYMRWRQGQALQQLGNPFRVRKLVLVRPGRRWIGQACFSMALTLLILGLAGPQWGGEPVETRRVQRDLVVVLDVSRSMQAEQPSRLERAVRALEHLNETIGKRGEVRLGLVLGAAHPRMQLPPSLNVEHFDFLLQRVRNDDLPRELWAGEKTTRSGTRIGAALARATELYQPARGGSFEILLVSDGDDPINDEEWRLGIQAARLKEIPIHVLAVGDPARSYRVPVDRKGDGPTTRLDESVLQEIARQTSGAYLPGHAATHVPLGSLMGEVLTQQRARESLLVDTPQHLTQPRSRQVWFFLAALGMLALALGINDARPRFVSHSPPPGRNRGAASRSRDALVTGALALLLISAASPTMEDYLRWGNEAYQNRKYGQALHWYEKAEQNALDPGLVAINKGMALYQMDRFDEAALHFERCLEDEAAPMERRRKAFYNLGAARLKESGGSNADLLKKAVEAFRACQESSPQPPLLEDTRYNLELAQTLWLKAAATPRNKEDNGDGGNDKSRKEGSKSGTDMKKEPSSGKETDKSDTKVDSKGQEKIEGKDRTPVPGSSDTSVDERKRKEISDNELRELLRQQVERIARQRQSDRREAWRSLTGVPNH